MNAITDPITEGNADANVSLMGEVLIAHAKLTTADVDRILHRQKEKNILFGEAAKELGLVSDKDLKKILSQQFEYAYIHENNQSISQKLIAAHTPFTASVEKLRGLRGQLMLRWFDVGQKMLCVSAVDVGDGASVLVANLAIVFSQLNKRTLLIDANLRSPNQHQLFGLEDKLGLSNILANRKGRYQLSRIESLPNLSILGAGTPAPNPQELLNREAFTGLLDDLQKMFDIILIDTTPANLGLDYLAVAHQAKGTLMIAAKDVTDFRALKQMRSQLEVTQTNIVGSVIQ